MIIQTSRTYAERQRKRNEENDEDALIDFLTAIFDECGITEAEIMIGE